MYDCLMKNIDVSSIIKLMQFNFDDFGTCVNGCTLLQNLILFRRRAEDIQILINEGICIDRRSFLFRKPALSLLLEEIVEIGNEFTPELRNLLEILCLFLQIEIYINLQDAVDLAYITCLC